MDDDRGRVELLDFGGLWRLERWGPVRLVRPDPRAVGVTGLPAAEWEAADAVFEGRLGHGSWRLINPVPAVWPVTLAGLHFEVRLAASMHTGLFPEQASHWQWMREVLTDGPVPLEILNLFAYTGGASLALAALGHRVTHVDASRPALGWARRNAARNAVASIRWIDDDVRAFVRRERRRRRRYAALILDPPEFGRGRQGVWRLDRDLPELLDNALALLDAEPRFVLLNTYGLGASAPAAGALLEDALAAAGHPAAARSVRADALHWTTRDGRLLPTGVFARTPA